MKKILVLSALALLSAAAACRTSTPEAQYANPIEAMGVDAFADAASSAGADGVLVVDYPPEESREFARVVRAAGLDVIFLLAPTSTDARIRAVGEIGSGYIYYVSLLGVTGAGHIDVSEVAKRIPAIRKSVGMPVGVGFGIRDAETARAISRAADAVVIGSKIIQLIDNEPHEKVVAVASNFIRTIRKALDA